jgi:hypothetical protein
MAKDKCTARPMNVKNRCELSPATVGATTCIRTLRASGATAVASRGVLPCSMSLIKGVVESVCRALALVDIMLSEVERAFFWILSQLIRNEL